MKRILSLMAVFLFMAMSRSEPRGEDGVAAAVLVSANAEWSVVKARHAGERFQSSPCGEYFLKEVKLPDGSKARLLFFHTGWGKVAAAASTQYVIQRWDPPLLINAGTCGGFEGAVDR